MTNATKIAFVFPGQGSQTVGMLSELATTHSTIKQTFAEASEVLGEDLWQLVQGGPQEALNLTENAQPALLTASVAVWRVMNELFQFQATAMAGHSLGEWSALVCSGALDFTDAVKLARLRGQYMQQAVPVGVGSMAAIIGLDDQTIAEVCSEASQDQIVSAVNFNSPGQVVIAGHAEAVARASGLCKAAGSKRALPLAVSAPFHTAMMKPAAERLALDMDAVGFRMPDVPVIHNVDARRASDLEQLKSIVVEQIYSPVRWVDCMKSIVELGVTDVIECGPGRVLSGLARRIEKSLNTHTSDSSDSLAALIPIMDDASGVQGAAGSALPKTIVG